MFQGQEFAASTPFLFFADFDADLNDAVRKGRCEFLTQFLSVHDYISTGGFGRSATQHALSNASALVCFAVAESRRHQDGRMGSGGLTLAIVG